MTAKRMVNTIWPAVAIIMAFAGILVLPSPVASQEFTPPAPADTDIDYLLSRYDTNGNGQIDKPEVLMAIDDYLFHELITKEQALKIIELYLFGDVPAPSQDRVALIALYNATNGANWTDDVNWLSDRPLDQWYGVTIDDEGHVTELFLFGNNLTGTIPMELGNLPSLESLVLDDNQLGGEIPTELGNMSSLINLSVIGNQLSGEIPPQLGDLPILESLNLTGNELNGKIPVELSELSSLKTLSLSKNKLSGQIPPELGRMPNLRSLWLNKNQLSGSIPLELGNMSSLEWLVLDFNQLSGEIPPVLGNLSRLFSLSISGNQLSGEIPPQLGNLRRLESLYLPYNRLTGEIPRELSNLTNLVILSLPDNQLDGEIPGELGNLSHLERLLLSDNQLSGHIPPELGRLADLEYLHLSRNRLNGEIPPELGHLSNLESLHLSGNRLSGCIPDELQNIPSNDLSSLQLSLCGDVVTASPDLVAAVTSVGDAGTLYAGESFSITATVENIGAGTADSTTLRYYRSTNSTISTNDTQLGTDPVDALNASMAGPESIQLTATSSTGTYYYGVCVDSVPGETDTQNNCSESIRIEVIEPAFISSSECGRTFFGARYTIRGTIFAVTSLKNVKVIGYGIDDFNQRTKVGEDDLGSMSAQTSKDFSISGINRLYTSCDIILEWDYE